MILSKNNTLLNLDKIIIVTLFIFVAASIFSISITQIAAGLGGLAWALKTHLTNTWKDQRWPLAIPILLFASACLVAVVDAYDVSYSFGSLKKLLELLIFFWVLNCVKNNSLRDQLVLTLITSTLIASFFGIYQASVSGVTLLTRVEGTLSVYMTFAGILMMVCLLALARVLYAYPKEIWLLPCIGIIITCLLFTLTRQAWLGFIVGSTFLVFTKKGKLFLILTLTMLAMVFVFKDSIRSKIMDVELSSEGAFAQTLIHRVHTTLEGGVHGTFAHRIFLWKGGWEIFKDHPLTGCGFRCVDKLHSKYPDPTGWVVRSRGMHNNFVQLAVDTGILGLFTWIGIWFCFFLMLYKRLAALDGYLNEKGIILGSAAGSLAFLTGGFFENNLYDSEVAMVLYFLMALPFSGSQKGMREDFSLSGYQDEPIA